MAKNSSHGDGGGKLKILTDFLMPETSVFKSKLMGGGEIIWAIGSFGQAMFSTILAFLSS